VAVSEHAVFCLGRPSKVNIFNEQYVCNVTNAFATMFINNRSISKEKTALHYIHHLISILFSLQNNLSSTGSTSIPPNLINLIPLSMKKRGLCKCRRNGNKVNKVLFFSACSYATKVVFLRK
jgi:hypothetical protein